MPKLNWNDFTSKNYDELESSVEKILIQYIKNKEGLQETKTISSALSGGMDSTLVLSYLKQVFPEKHIKTFSIKFADSVDETQHASNIAKFLDVEHEIIYLENFFEELPKAISITKLPFWDIHWYYLVKNAQKHSKFLLSGDGGDELFGGYTFRYEKFLSLTTNDATPVEKTQNYLKCHERDHVPDQELLFHENVKFSWNEIYSQIIPYFDNSLDPLEQVFFADYSGKLLYNFSIVNNRINESFNVHAVSPLLASQLISIAPHIPLNMKYNVISNQGKIILKNLLIRNKLDSLIMPSKQGFSVNTKSLWKNIGKRICLEYLSDSQIAKNGFINSKWIENHIRNDDLEVRYINKFYGLLAFEIWYRLFVTKEINSNLKLI